MGGRLVVGVDGSDHAARALRWAIDEARLRGAWVEAVHAWDYPVVSVTGFPVPDVDLEAIEQSARATLDHAVDQNTAPDVEIRRSVVAGPAPTALLEAATDADLLVVGSRGRGGFAGLLLGSVSQQCAQHARCPVVIVPSRDGQA